MKLYAVAVALAFDHGHTALRVEPLGAVKHVLLESVESAEVKRKHEEREELLAHEAMVERGYGYRVRSEAEEERAEDERRTRRGGETRTLATELLKQEQLEQMESQTGSSGVLVAPPGSFDGHSGSIYIDDKDFILIAEKNADRVLGLPVLFPGDEPMKHWHVQSLEAGYNRTISERQNETAPCTGPTPPDKRKGENCFAMVPVAIATLSSVYNEYGSEMDPRAANLYVAEATKMTRWIDGQFDPSFAMEGIFKNPFEMVTTKNGRLYISDTGNNRILQIKLLDFHDDMVEDDGTCKDGDPTSPTCLWWRKAEYDAEDYDDRTHYQWKEAEDALLQTRERVSPEDLEKAAGGAKPDPTGDWEMHIVVGGDGTNPGSGLNQLDTPMGIAVHMTTHHGPKADSPEVMDLFVADAHHRVLKFTMTAHDENKMVIDTNGPPTNQTIHHVKWNEFGEIVAGSGVNAAGNCCVAGSDRGSLNKPTGLAVKDHWLYISDSGNDRVLMWEIGAKSAIQIIRAIKEPHDLALWSNRVAVLDGEGTLRMFNLPCSAPPMENTKKESCAGAMLIPDGATCEPACTDSFGHIPLTETDRLQCNGRPLRFKCELADVPLLRVTDVAFKDTDPEWKELGGVITWHWPANAEAFSQLDIYYGKTGDPAKTLLDSIPSTNLSVHEWSFEELGENYRTARGIAFCASGELRLYLRNKFGLSERVAILPYEDYVEGGWKKVAEDEEQEDETAQNACDVREGIAALAISKPDCTSKTNNDTKEGDSPECFTEEEEGMYFFFDKAKFQKRFGYEVENGQLVRMSLLRHEYKVGTGQIKVFCDEKVATVGDCRGRIDPEWAAEKHQWKVGDVLIPTSFTVQATNKKGCYDPDSACCQDGKECWPIAGKYFFFNKASAEDALGQALETNDTVKVRQLRDTVGVWEGMVMIDCRRPVDDDSSDLWGDCFGQVCADPVKYDENGRCVTESYVLPDEPLPRWAENDWVQPLGAGQALKHRNQTHGLHDPVPPEDESNVTKGNATSLLSFVERLQFGNLRENMRR